jgi:hypothetical protein
MILHWHLSNDSSWISTTNGIIGDDISLVVINLLQQEGNLTIFQLTAAGSPPQRPTAAVAPQMQ